MHNPAAASRPFTPPVKRSINYELWIVAAALLLTALIPGLSKYRGEDAGTSSSTNEIFWCLMYVATAIRLYTLRATVVPLFKRSAPLWIFVFLMFASVLWSVDPATTFTNAVELIGTTIIGFYIVARFTLPQFIAQCVAFTILALLLYKLGWKPVRDVLEQRRSIIEQSMQNADKIKQQLADAEATRLSIIQQANEKANLIIAEAEKSAAVITEQRAREAVRQAEDIVKNAHEASVLDKNRLMNELKQHIGELVIQTTEKVAGKVLTPADQARLNSETLTQLGANNN